jgi:hypothetical protein
VTGGLSGCPVIAKRGDAAIAIEVPNR